MNSNLYVFFFSQDHIYDESSTTQDLYDDVVSPIVEKSVKGFNGTIFAYGQTSSGKHLSIGFNEFQLFISR